MASTDSNTNTNPTPRAIRGTNSPRPSPSARQPDYMNGKVFIAAGIILVVIIFFIVAFHLYTRVFWRRRRPSISWRLNLASSFTGGLDKAIVNSLPTFTYTMPFLREGGNVVSKEEAGEGVVECAVCLIEFEENDECRLLPKCNHSFHTECIDKWFLSNTTCPLCRSSAEPDGSNDAGPTESSTAFSLSHQELGDHVGRTNSSPSDCLLPRQDSGSHIPWQGINDHMQRSRASSPLAPEVEGAGLHVRRMLARTCSSGVDASYDLVGEGMQNDTMSVAMLGEKLSTMARERARRNLAGEASSVRHPHLPNWQRSVSDKSLNTREAMEFPSNVLFWGNHSHVDSRLRTDHWQVGGRSLPHISIDVRRPQDSVLKPHSALSSPTQFLATGERACVSPSGLRQPSRMNPLKSEEIASHLAEHGKL